MTFWNRHKTEFDVVVMDLSSNAHKLKVKAEATPQEIMKELNIENAFLVIDGMFVAPRFMKKLLKDGSILWACPIQDKG